MVAHARSVLSHVVDFGGGSSIETAVYRHDFDRTWRKVNAVKLLPARLDIFEVLRNPTAGRNPFARAGAAAGPHHRSHRPAWSSAPTTGCSCPRA